MSMAALVSVAAGSAGRGRDSPCSRVSAPSSSAGLSEATPPPEPA